jgi:hypothetical protein
MLETHFRAGVFFILHTSSQLVNAMNHTGSITCRKSRFSDVYCIGPVRYIPAPESLSPVVKGLSSLQGNIYSRDLYSYPQFSNTIEL